MSARPTKPASSFYSYSAKRSLRQEEVAAYKRIALATIIIVVLLVGGYFVGIPLIGQIGSDSTPIVNRNSLGTTDSIPPTSPRIDGLPDISRSRTIDITGNAESGSTVKIMVNDREQASVISDKNGTFQAQVTLTGGQNSITATATDTVGNVSRASKTVSITYSQNPPKISISSPSQSSLSVNTSNITISGSTASDATVTINDRQIIVQPDGKFSSVVNLTNGENTVTIVATDVAGNTSKVTKTVTYASQSSTSAN